MQARRQAEEEAEIRLQQDIEAARVEALLQLRLIENSFALSNLERLRRKASLKVPCSICFSTRTWKSVERQPIPFCSTSKFELRRPQCLLLSLYALPRSSQFHLNIRSEINYLQVLALPEAASSSANISGSSVLVKSLETVSPKSGSFKPDLGANFGPSRGGKRQSRSSPSSMLHSSEQMTGKDLKGEGRQEPAIEEPIFPLGIRLGLLAGTGSATWLSCLRHLCIP